MLTTQTFLPPWQLPSSDTLYAAACAGALYYYDLMVESRPDFIIRRTHTEALCECGVRTAWWARPKGDPAHSELEEPVCSDGCGGWAAADWDMDDVDEEDCDYDDLE